MNMHFRAEEKLSNTCWVMPVLKMRSTLPANIGSFKPAGAAKLSLYPVKSLAERRAVISIYIYIYSNKIKHIIQLQTNTYFGVMFFIYHWMFNSHCITLI